MPAEIERFVRLRIRLESIAGQVLLSTDTVIRATDLIDMGCEVPDPGKCCSQCWVIDSRMPFTGRYVVEIYG